MKALFPKQRTAADFFIDVLGQGSLLWTLRVWGQVKL